MCCVNATLYVESWEVSEQLILQIYEEMAANNVNGWDYIEYTSPRYFDCSDATPSLAPSRTPSMAAMSMGWDGPICKRYRDASGATLFDWPAALEKPLGRNADYVG